MDSALHSPLSEQPTSFSLVADGNATPIGIQGNPRDGVISPEPGLPSPPVLFPIGDEVEMIPHPSNASEASLRLDAVVIQRNSTGVVSYEITGGSVAVDGTSYQVVNGTGIINQNSLVVAAHVTVESDHWRGMLILVGRAGHALSSSGTVDVVFRSPESKLASRYFLDLRGSINPN